MFPCAGSNGRSWLLYSLRASWARLIGSSAILLVTASGGWEELSSPVWRTFPSSWRLTVLFLWAGSCANSLAAFLAPFRTFPVKCFLLHVYLLHPSTYSWRCQNLPTCLSQEQSQCPRLCETSRR